MRILAVGKNQTTLQELTEMIREIRPAAQIHTFGEGEELLTYAAEHAYDIAFVEAGALEIDAIEIAMRLRRIYPRVNLIFVAASSEYAAEAMKLHCSGYLQRPVTREKLRYELDDLRYPLEVSEKQRLHFRCFGNFEVYLDGKPVIFRHEKTKEYLAYLVDRDATVTNGEIEAALWETPVNPSYVRILRKELMDLLKSAGLQESYIHQRNAQRLAREHISCDYYDWKDGLAHGRNAYRGEYMSQYSWAEQTHAALEHGII